MAKRRRNDSTAPWRQDFRDVQALPDLKIVRTHFISNFMAGLVLLIAAGLAVYQNYVISVRSQSITQSEREIKDSLNSDKRNQADSARFSRDVVKVAEAAHFMNAPVTPESLVADLARVQPPQGRYASIEYARMADAKLANPLPSYRVTLQGSMSPDTEGGVPAPVLIDRFMEILRGMPAWNGVKMSAELISSEPEKDLNYFEYSLKLEWSQPVAGGNAK